MKNRKKEILDNINKRPLFALITLLLILYILIFFRHILIYMIILIFSGILHYRHYKGFPKINFGHIFFIAFIIDWHDGLTGEILFILLAGLIPELLAKSFELKTLFAYPIMIGFISIPIFLIHSNYVLIGIMSSISYYGLMFMISGITKEPMHERVLEVVLPCILNIIYFMYLAKPFYSFLDKTIY